jgi:enoyl-CoA hydratase/carnithine racemase
MNDILVQSEDGVTALTLNRADKKNALTGAMYTALADALESAQNDPAVRVVLIQGTPAVFCAGNDIGDFQNGGPADENPPVRRFQRSLAQLTKPVVAAVCGPAVGIGTTMLFHCDLVYAGDNAKFAMPFVNLGLCPEAASSLLAPQVFGYHRAAEAFLLGDPFTADTALELGLVNRVAPPDEVNGLALAQALKLAAKPLSSLIETKRLLRGGQQAAVLARMDEERVVFTRLRGEPAAREAFAAFQEKRKPNFSQF